MEIVRLPKVQKIYKNAFSGCKGLKSVELPNCTEIGWEAFSYCSSLESVKLPNVQKISDDVFWYCKLKLLKIPKCIKVTGVKGGGIRFSKKLIEVDIRSLDFYNIKNVFGDYYNSDTKTRNEANFSVIISNSIQGETLKTVRKYFKIYYPNATIKQE